MTLNNTLQRIAKELAIDSKASGIDDFGCFKEAEWNLTDDEWTAVCEAAERLLPTVKVPREVQAEWAAANREFRAEQAADRRSVYGGSF